MSTTSNVNRVRAALISGQGNQVRQTFLPNLS
jgi:hypothetical protein